MTVGQTTWAVGARPALVELAKPAESFWGRGCDGVARRSAVDLAGTGSLQYSWVHIESCRIHIRFIYYGHMHVPNVILYGSDYFGGSLMLVLARDGDGSVGHCRKGVTPGHEGV